MVTTTIYGTWNNRVQPSDQNLESSVANALGDYASDYDMDAVAADWREAINEALPENVTLAGEEFIGPYYDEDRTWVPDQEDEDGRLDLKAIVDGIDFWAIAARHDKGVADPTA